MALSCENFGKSWVFSSVHKEPEGMNYEGNPKPELGSSGKVSAPDMSDHLPDDPFGMDIRSKFNSLMHDCEKDFEEIFLDSAKDETEKKNGDNRILSGVNLVWSSLKMDDMSLPSGSCSGAGTDNRGSGLDGEKDVIGDRGSGFDGEEGTVDHGGSGFDGEEGTIGNGDVIIDGVANGDFVSDGVNNGDSVLDGDEGTVEEDFVFDGEEDTIDNGNFVFDGKEGTIDNGDFDFDFDGQKSTVDDEDFVFDCEEGDCVFYVEEDTVDNGDFVFDGEEGTIANGGLDFDGKEGAVYNGDHVLHGEMGIENGGLACNGKMDIIDNGGFDCNGKMVNDIGVDYNNNRGDGGGFPHNALFVALSYLGVKELLLVEQVCKSFREAVRNPLLWTSIHIDKPLSEIFEDEDLMKLASRADGDLQCLSLVNCFRITDNGLKSVLERNLRLRKLGVPGCVKLSIEGILYNLRIFNSIATPGIKSLRIGGLFGITNNQYEEFKSLLGADDNVKKLKKTQKPTFLRWGQTYLTFDDDRPIDIELCPKCRKLGLLYDCTLENCQSKKCTRACALCIARCVRCGRCTDECQYTESFVLDVYCDSCEDEFFDRVMNFGGEDGSSTSQETVACQETSDESTRGG